MKSKAPSLTSWRRLASSAVCRVLSSGVCRRLGLLALSKRFVFPRSSTPLGQEASHAKSLQLLFTTDDTAEGPVAGGAARPVARATDEDAWPVADCKGWQDSFLNLPLIAAMAVLSGVMHLSGLSSRSLHRVP